MAHNETLVDPKEKELSKEILNFLKDGEGQLAVGKFKNVTLVLGFTGSGKSTVTQFITGNDDGLFSEEIGDDTGEFTITDKNNNVCKATIESCTIIPTLYVDKDTNSGFFDCPGFGDTRSVKHDISVTYFIKKVVDSVEAVKLLFVVNYPAVRQGVDRQNFMLLVKNVVSMVKDVEKFKDGIALIVTKVDNQYKIKRGQAVLVSDETIIGNIAKFLEGVEDFLKAKEAQEADSNLQAYYRNGIKFVNILKEKRGQDYTRIGIFRRPDEAGKLRDTALLKSGKAHFDKILRENIRYVPKTKEDFGYTLSADSLNHMHTLISNINEDLALNFGSMVIPIQQHYLWKERNSKNIEELSRIFTHGYETLSAIKGSQKFSTPVALMGEIRNLAEENDVQIPQEIVANIVHYDNFLNFVKSLSDLKSSPLQWLQGLNEVLTNMSGRREWLNLLVTLQSELSKYTILKEITKNQTSTAALRDAISSYEVSGLQEGLSTRLQEFLQQVFKKNYEREYGKIHDPQNVNIDEWKLLKDLLDFRVISSCDSGSSAHELTGRYVKISDIKETKCSKKRINIFALQKVFIDEDLIKKGEKIQLVIMAPTWEVVGAPKIILDGEDGRDYEPRKAEDGVQSTFQYYGWQGSPGGDGGAAGLFWGIGEQCFNCQHLKISANGGRGGNGQDGGDGADGLDFHIETTGDKDGVLIAVVYNRRVYDKERWGQPGGDGGKGGDGGYGGPHGKVKFLMFGGGSKPLISATDGAPGYGGVGGAPGEGGRSDRIITKVQTALIIPWETNEVQSLPRAPAGRWGEHGHSLRGVRGHPETFSSNSKTLANYTEKLRFEVSIAVVDSTSRLFLQNLETKKVEDPNKRRRRRHAEHGEDNSPVRQSSRHRAISFLKTTVKMIGRHFENRLPEGNELELRRPGKTMVMAAAVQNEATLLDTPKITGRSHDTQLTGMRPDSDIQGNVLLLDYLVRMNFARKSRFGSNRPFALDYEEHAHNMAYRAYVPQNV